MHRVIMLLLLRLRFCMPGYAGFVSVIHYNLGIYIHYTQSTVGLLMFILLSVLIFITGCLSAKNDEGA